MLFKEADTTNKKKTLSNKWQELMYTCFCLILICFHPMSVAMLFTNHLGGY